jgi:hypothetical protein
MGIHPKGLAEGGYAGFCLIQYNNSVANLISTATCVFNDLLARPKKWWPKWHPSSTVGVHDIRLVL